MIPEGYHTLAELPVEGQVCIVRDGQGITHLAEFHKWNLEGVTKCAFFELRAEHCPIPSPYCWIEYDPDID